MYMYAIPIKRRRSSRSPDNGPVVAGASRQEKFGFSLIKFHIFGKKIRLN